MIIIFSDLIDLKEIQKLKASYVEMQKSFYKCQQEIIILKDEDKKIKTFITVLRYEKENKINTWNYDHANGRFQKGINILTAFYNNEDLNIPIGYEIVEKDIIYKDNKTGKTKRKASCTKNDLFRNLLHIASQNKVKYEYILADSWYDSKDNMKYIDKELEKKFVFGMKSNRLFSMYDENSKTWSSYSQLKHSNIESNRSYLIKLNGCNILLTLSKKIFKNGDGSVGILYIVSNDLKLKNEEIYELYQKRWSIEVYHKNLKNHASLSKSPTKIEKTQKAHIYMSILSYSKLEFMKANYNNQQQLKELLLIKANKAAMAELAKLQKQFSMIA